MVVIGPAPPVLDAPPGWCASAGDAVSAHAPAKSRMLWFTVDLHCEPERASFEALDRKRSSGRQWRGAAQAGAAEKAWRRLEAPLRSVGNWPEREDERDQCQRERRKACHRCTMQRALVMLMLALRGRPRAI